jgi:hypothetical protein
MTSGVGSGSTSGQSGFALPCDASTDGDDRVTVISARRPGASERCWAVAGLVRPGRRGAEAEGRDVIALGGQTPTFDCDGCGRRRSGPSTTTATGRRLCADCADGLAGATAALVAGGGVGEAIATAAWYTRLRGRLRR